MKNNKRSQVVELRKSIVDELFEHKSYKSLGVACHIRLLFVD